MDPELLLDAIPDVAALADGSYSLADLGQGAADAIGSLGGAGGLQSQLGSFDGGSPAIMLTVRGTMDPNAVAAPMMASGGQSVPPFSQGVPYSSQFNQAGSAPGTSMLPPGVGPSATPSVAMNGNYGNPNAVGGQPQTLSGSPSPLAQPTSPYQSLIQSLQQYRQNVANSPSPAQIALSPYNSPIDASPFQPSNAYANLVQSLASRQ